MINLPQSLFGGVYNGYIADETRNLRMRISHL